jgi:hypothetical protein
LLATLGAAAGLSLSYWFSGVLVKMLADSATLTLHVATDWRVLAFHGRHLHPSCACWRALRPVFMRCGEASNPR